MMMLIATGTILAIVLILYHHAGYPLVLRWLGTAAAPPPPIPSVLPPITLVVPAYNEAAVIARKIANLAALSYPQDRLSIIIACDGCTDETVAIARHAAAEHPACPIEIRDFSYNRGKIAVLNDVLSPLATGIVCLTDASALLSADALVIAAAHFADPRIAVVAGTYRFATEGSAGETAYWRYQVAVKHRESALGGVIGVHGSCWFFRAGLARPLEPDTINDDFILPMRIVAQGYRAVYEQAIVATELEVASLALDRRRRLRIAAGNMQQLIRLAGLLHPRHGGVAFCFWSGKALRVLCPYLMIGAWAGSLILAFYGSLFFTFTFLVQTALYSLALTPLILPMGFLEARLRRVVSLVHYLVIGHLMSLIGGTRYLLGLDRGRWHRVAGPEPAMAATHISRASQIGKRVFDIVGSLIGLSLGLVLLIPIALAIKLSSPGPLIFRQYRIGRALADRTELFMMYKFRSMYIDAEAKTGPIWASRNDPRITPVGRFLRKTRLDEIPQLVNVLRGDMSLVGPRPERPGITRRLEGAIPFFTERTYGIRPGITGLAQVNQGYDETIEDVKSKVLYDHAYSLSIMNFWGWLTTDLTILCKTVSVILLGRGQ